MFKTELDFLSRILNSKTKITSRFSQNDVTIKLFIFTKSSTQVLLKCRFLQRCLVFYNVAGSCESSSNFVPVLGSLPPTPKGRRKPRADLRQLCGLRTTKKKERKNTPGSSAVLKSEVARHRNQDR